MENLLTEHVDAQDFKLPLRQWLIKQIDSNKYPGLEWETRGVIFRLPWEKKHGVGWEEKHKLFRAWYAHRKRTSFTNGNVECDPGKLKANFRSALNKSESFIELKDRHQLSNQSGNYKVYKILTPQEVEDNKKRNEKLKRKAKKESSSSSMIDCNGIMDTNAKKEKLYSNGTDIDLQDDFLNANLEQFAQNNGSSPFIAMSPQTTFSSPNNWECQSDFLFNGKQEMVLQKPVVNNNAWPTMPLTNISCPPNVSTLNARDIECSMEKKSMDLSSNEQVLSSVVNSLPLSRYSISIYYAGKQVYERNDIDLTAGIRLHYKLGKNDKTAKIVTNSDPIWEEIFKYQEIQLPESNDPSAEYLKLILDGMRLGFILKYDHNHVGLRVSRLCQSHIFLATTDRGPPYPKLEKQTMEMAYDIGECIRKAHIEPQDDCVYFSCGVKPKNKPVNLANEKGVWVKVRSQAAVYFNQISEEQKQSMSLCFSNMTPLEDLIKNVSFNN